MSYISEHNLLIRKANQFWAKARKLREQGKHAQAEKAERKADQFWRDAELEWQAAKDEAR